MFTILWCTNVHHSMGHCSPLYGALFNTLWGTVQHSMGHCSPLYGALFTTLWGTVHHSMGHCSPLYGALFTTLWGTVHHSMGHCLPFYWAKCSPFLEHYVHHNVHTSITHNCSLFHGLHNVHTTLCCTPPCRLLLQHRSPSLNGVSGLATLR